MKGGSKEYWFVLTAESLSWYKDEEVREFGGGDNDICRGENHNLGGNMEFWGVSAVSGLWLRKSWGWGVGISARG